MSPASQISLRLPTIKQQYCPTNKPASNSHPTKEAVYDKECKGDNKTMIMEWSAISDLEGYNFEDGEEEVTEEKTLMMC
eukprot:14278904-Ditylum_brightwellii.AAC.1